MIDDEIQELEQSLKDEEPLFYEVVERSEPEPEQLEQPELDPEKSE